MVHLVKEGTFYHANDWSAWLLVRFPIGEAVNKPLSVTAKRLEDGYVHAFVGFPATSMQKYIPNDGSVQFQPVNDNQIDVTLTQVDFGDATEEDIRRQVDEWKASLPMKDSKKQRRESGEAREQAPRARRLSDIAGQILAFDLSHSSPADAWEFIRSLQRDVAAIF